MSILLQLKNVSNPYTVLTYVEDLFVRLFSEFFIFCFNSLSYK